MWIIFLVTRMVPTSFVDRGQKLRVLSPNRRPLFLAIFGLKICIFLRYTYETPIFWGPTDRFMAPIAQSGPFWAQKQCFLAQNQFFVDSLKKLPVFGQKMARKSDFFTLHPYNPIFWAQTNSTQWDHKFPIS